MREAVTEQVRELTGKLAALPKEEQERYAATFLKELENDRRWEQLFAQTTDEQWKKLAEQARQEIEEDEYERILSDL